MERVKSKSFLHAVNTNSQTGIPFSEHVSRADSRFEPSQWETALRCNDVSHWLGASLEWALCVSTVGRWYKNPDWTF